MGRVRRGARVGAGRRAPVRRASRDDCASVQPGHVQRDGHRGAAQGRETARRDRLPGRLSNQRRRPDRDRVQRLYEPAVGDQREEPVGVLGRRFGVRCRDAHALAVRERAPPKRRCAARYRETNGGSRLRRAFPRGRDAPGRGAGRRSAADFAGAAADDDPRRLVLSVRALHAGLHWQGRAAVDRRGASE